MPDEDQRRAFAREYEHHQHGLYCECLAVTGDREDARDAVQSAMLRAYRAIRRGDRPQSLRAWLHRIARNEAIDVLRRRRVHGELHDTDSDPAPGPSACAIAHEGLDTLVRDVNDLPARQRQALVMRAVDGCGYGEIADGMGISGGAARQSVCEARAMLVE
ncbi:MAG TPA: sigma-70 family RNA polymerase sigma factor, partial [Solirubrobacteraceae bacterium]|nr:sigma-70 family RNA polymerase sigma factor [Solirubrobacteraceae bacterium]